jgi:hypothetical protein
VCGSKKARVGSSHGLPLVPTPAHPGDHEIRVEVAHDDFNSRTMLADGTPILPDLRRILYGDAGRG